MILCVQNCTDPLLSMLLTGDCTRSSIQAPMCYRAINGASQPPNGRWICSFCCHTQLSAILTPLTICTVHTKLIVTPLRCNWFCSTHPDPLLPVSSPVENPSIPCVFCCLQMRVVYFEAIFTSIEAGCRHIENYSNDVAPAFTGRATNVALIFHCHTNCHEAISTNHIL